MSSEGSALNASRSPLKPTFINALKASFSCFIVYTGCPGTSSGWWYSSSEPLKTSACTSQRFWISSIGSPSFTSCTSSLDISTGDTPAITSANFALTSATVFPACSSWITSLSLSCLSSSDIRFRLLSINSLIISLLV